MSPKPVHSEMAVFKSKAPEYPGQWCRSSIREIFWVLTSVLLLLSFSHLNAAFAQDPAEEKDPRRLALVIGNANYTNLAPLVSTRSDAEKMRDRLNELGFEVSYYPDIRTYFEFEETVLQDFRRKLSHGDFIVFYFSGHGFAHGPDNFLAPTEIPLSITEDKVPDYAISVGALKSYFETHSPGLMVFIIDACRSLGGFIVRNRNNENVVPKGPV